MAITKSQASNILQYVFGRTSYSAPTILYVGLSTTVPAFDGTNITEPPTTAGYGRVSYSNVNPGAWSDPSAVDGSVTNINAITFNTSTATWGTDTIKYVFIASSVSGTGTDILYFEALDNPITVEPNTTIQFAASTVTISMTNT